MKKKDINRSRCINHPVFGKVEDLPSLDPSIMPLPENGDPKLCGFVWKHDEKDYSAWEVELSEEDRDAIEKILMKYETEGSSVRNCYNARFNEVFS